MSKFYGTVIGASSTVGTRRGHHDIRVSAQSYDGSVITRLDYDSDDKLRVRIGTNEGSSTCSDWSSQDFNGTFEEFKELLKLHNDIKSGRVSVVRHRKPKVNI